MSAWAPGTRDDAGGRPHPRRRGIASGEITGTDHSLEQSVDGLRSVQLDALFFVSGIPNTVVAQLSDSVPIRLVDLGAPVEASW